MHNNTETKIREALRAAGLPTFRDSYMDPAANAADNLDRLTRWAANAKHHRARILHSSKAHSGSIFWALESSPEDYNSTRNTRRAAVFDCFGDLIHETARHRTTDQCLTELYKWLQDFDPVQHYKRAMHEHAERLQAEALRFHEAADSLQFI